MPRAFRLGHKKRQTETKGQITSKLVGGNFSFKKEDRAHGSGRRNFGVTGLFLEGQSSKLVIVKGHVLLPFCLLVYHVIQEFRLRNGKLLATFH